MPRPTWHTVHLSRISARPGYESTELHDSDITVLANLSSAALDALALLRPIVVEKSSGQDTYRLLAGGCTFRALRAARGESSATLVLVLTDELPTPLITAVDKLVIPAAEGAGLSEQLIRRWVSYVDESHPMLPAIGLQQASRQELAHHLSITRNRLYRAIKAPKESDQDDEG